MHLSIGQYNEIIYKLRTWDIEDFRYTIESLIVFNYCAQIIQYSDVVQNRNYFQRLNVCLSPHLPYTMGFMVGLRSSLGTTVTLNWLVLMYTYYHTFRFSWNWKKELSQCLPTCFCSLMFSFSHFILKFTNVVGKYNQGI